MRAITIGYRVMPLNYVRKHSPRYVVYKYINKKILQRSKAVYFKFVKHCKSVLRIHRYCYRSSY